MMAKTKPGKKTSRQAESTVFRFTTAHAFTGKYAQRFHAELNIPTACECGEDPHHVVFDCSQYNAARAVAPRFDIQSQ